MFAVRKLDLKAQRETADPSQERLGMTNLFFYNSFGEQDDPLTL
jgi:hypothetical protein